MSSERVGSGLRAALSPGALILALVTLVTAGHLWLARAVLVPLPSNHALDYVFVSASFGSFVVLAAGTFALICAAHLLVRALARVDQPPLWAIADVAYLLPLLWLAASALGLLNLLPDIRVPALVNYVVLDLRWWWTALIVAWTVARADRRAGGALRAVAIDAGTTPWVRRFGPQAALVAIALTWVVAGTPRLRYQPPKIGDEPKYMRYCESLYQGLGFEVSGVRTLPELGPGFKPHVWRNVGLIAYTLPGELRDLAADARSLVGGPKPVRTAATDIGGFIRAPTGGVFQLHNPGLPMLLFPAYYIDRRFGALERRTGAQWPDNLPVLNTFLLALYALWVLLIYRLFRLIGAGGWPPWIASLVVVLTLPIAAFPFQVYPEIAAGVLLTAVATHVLSADTSHRFSSFCHGLLLGYLPWLHVRFSALVFVMTVAAIVRFRRDRRKALAVVAGVGVLLACLSLFAYRVTGSLIPIATYYVKDASEPLSVDGALRGSVGYLIDRNWGLFAHSPVFLLALPGFWSLVRRRPDVAVVSAATFGALVVTAGAYSLHGAGTTPMRFIVAAIPIGFVSLTESLSRWGRSRLFQLAFALLCILSLQTALGYNLHHTKGVMIDYTVSGWKTNLLFPVDSRTPWSTSIANGIAYIVWIVVAVALLVLPHAGAFQWRLRPRSPAVHAFATIVCFVIIATAASAAIGVQQGGRYLIPPERAAEKAAAQIDESGHCSICASSSAGALGTGEMLDALERVVPSVAGRANGRRYADWVAMPGRFRDWWGEAYGTDPTPGDIGHLMYLWSQDRVPASEVRRRIFAAAGKTVPEER